MANTEIVKYGNDVLRAKAAEVEELNDEIKELIQYMCQALVEHHGYGVAGPQVGASKRIFVYDIGEGPHAFINPKIISSGGEDWMIEGCLSIPGLQGEVPRAERVVVTGIDENGEKVKIKANGLLARVFQHEIDHLDGTLFVDRADPDTLETVSPREDDEDEDAEE